MGLRFYVQKYLFIALLAPLLERNTFLDVAHKSLSINSIPIRNLSTFFMNLFLYSNANSVDLVLSVDYCAGSITHVRRPRKEISKKI